MKKKIKFILEIFIYIIIFVFIFNKLTLLFVRKGDGYGTDVLNFYKQEKNSIDVLFLGSSHAYTAFNPEIIKEQTNLNSYIFATTEQSMLITYHYLKEALKYQNPKQIILEVHMMVYQKKNNVEGRNRAAIDKMRFSLNKIELIKASIKKEDRLSYYFNIAKYHSRYKELTEIDFNTVFNGYTIDNKGYKSLPHNGYMFDVTKIEHSNVEGELNNKEEDYLYKIMNLCKKNNIKLIFVKTPALYNEKYYENLNSTKRIANDNNILFVNYIENIDKLNLDYELDFFDDGHLSWSGSNKVTLDFVKYLK